MYSSSDQDSREQVLTVFFQTLKHFFDSPQSLFSPIVDPRQSGKIKYSLSCLCFTGLLMYLLRLKSRHMITTHLRYDSLPSKSKYYELFGISEVPHGDTVNDAFCKLSAEEVQECVHEMIRQLIRKKVLYSHRINGVWFGIAIDATWLYTFKERHCEHCLKMDHGEGKITYYHPVLEAKLITPNGFAFSIMTEFIENEDEQVSKQDCELKAFYRLAPRLKAAFPHLPICLLMDGLYAHGEVFSICEANSWKYIIVLKDKDLPLVEQEYQSLLPLNPRNQLNQQIDPQKHNGHRLQHRWITDIQYKDTKRRMHLLHVLQTNKYAFSKLSTPNTKFKFVSNIKPKMGNVPNLSQWGRFRWKIENEGFNTQKNQGFALEHAYSKDPNALKIFYLILQMASIIDQLLGKGNLIDKELKKRLKTAIALADRLKEAWRTFEITHDKYTEICIKRIQIRFFLESGALNIPGSNESFFESNSLKIPKIGAGGGLDQS